MIGAVWALIGITDYDMKEYLLLRLPSSLYESPKFPKILGVWSLRSTIKRWVDSLFCGEIDLYFSLEVLRTNFYFSNSVILLINC